MRTSKPDKPHDRKRQEIRTGCRTATSQKRGTQSLRDLASAHLARVERPATRTKARSQETMTFRGNATMQTAFRAQISRECAIEPMLPRRRASRTAVVHTTERVSLEGAGEPFAGS